MSRGLHYMLTTKLVSATTTSALPLNHRSAGMNGSLMHAHDMNKTGTTMQRPNRFST
jgi:hypothetical protein